MNILGALKAVVGAVVGFVAQWAGSGAPISWYAVLAAALGALSVYLVPNKSNDPVEPGS